jgi:hypothetical protein
LIRVIARASGTHDREWNDSQPIYRQLRDRVVAMILDGVLKEGDPLPSVRHVAPEYRVNPLTVLKGYQQLVPAQQRAMIAASYDFAGFVLILTAFVVGVFYSLDGLHGERRDRSILFWKSLPVADLTTVLSKTRIPLVVLPLLAFAIIVTTHLIMMLWSSAVLLTSGLAATTWTRFSLFQQSLSAVDSLRQLTPGPFLRAPGLWIRLAFGAISVAIANHSDPDADTPKGRAAGALGVRPPFVADNLLREV